MESRRCPIPTPAPASTQTPPASGPRCLKGAAIRRTDSSNAIDPVLPGSSTTPAMPHMIRKLPSVAKGAAAQALHRPARPEPLHPRHRHAGCCACIAPTCERVVCPAPAARSTGSSRTSGKAVAQRAVCESSHRPRWLPYPGRHRHTRLRPRHRPSECPHGRRPSTARRRRRRGQSRYRVELLGAGNSGCGGTGDGRPRAPSHRRAAPGRPRGASR